MKNRPEVKSSKLIYSDYFDVKQDLLRRADGKTHPYTSLLLGTDATVILGQDREGRWILNREYRHPSGQFLLGCPGGRLEKGEDPILGGQREFFEETGYWSDEIALMGCSFGFPAICEQKIYFLRAKNCEKRSHQNLDPFEFIEVELKTDEELQQEILSSCNIDSLLCSALWYKDHFS